MSSLCNAVNTGRRRTQTSSDYLHMLHQNYNSYQKHVSPLVDASHAKLGSDKQLGIMAPYVWAHTGKQMTDAAIKLAAG